MKTLFVVTIASFAMLFMMQLAPARGFGGAHGSFGNSEESFGGRSREGGNSGGFSREGGNSRGRQEGGGESGGYHANAEKSGGYHEGGGQGGRYTAGNTEDRGRQQSGRNSSGADEGAAAGYARENNKNPQTTGAEGAAAGAAHTNRNEPSHSGVQGAAAGTAAANRNEPSYSGAQGAAAGAAAANRNQPSYSGTQGAAAGAAVANRNQPSYSGAQGAAAGAAVANRNAPTYSGAQGAAAGAAVANRNAPTYSGAQGAIAGYAAGAGTAGGYQGGSVGLPTDAGYGMAAGAVAGATAVNHRTVPINGSVLAASGTAVRDSYAGVGAFNQAWYGAHPGAWTAAGWTAARAWSPATFAAVAPALGWPINVQPVAYDYGANITYQGDQVYYGNQPVATADQYYQQAATLAQSAPPADPQATNWMPLGVFALVKDAQDTPHYVMQLAIDKSGALAGNYCDLVSDTVHPIHGAVDRDNQRVAWRVGNNARTVGEVGLVNLTRDEAPVLIHIGKDKTQQWMLVRLKQPVQ